ncbi:hypothetical protein J4E93_009616 [Alternaria ventricosa]|uniref:uncharacterized protein n=1 Tax=Alternaria ventricosa TaxID=1187951 RepID=UPI0020C48E3A|nr:uncharacterized protein J4E93_009616 [Alternaria ventricosa]KAI4638866.1 hypothetical protein J4E93_009616 [Alternaria ventricosa]
MGKVGKKKGRELQSMLQNLSPEEWNGEAPDGEVQDEEAQDEEVPNEEAQDEEAQNEEASDEEAPDEEPPHLGANEDQDSISLPSNPYPEDDFLLPLTRQPARTTPPPPFPSPPNLIIHPNSSPGLSIPSPGLSIPSNPYPEDAPNDDDGVEGGYTYAPNHPYHGMSAQETSEYWLGLEGYHTESERNLRRGQGRGRRRTVSSPVQYDAERVFGSVGESYEDGGVDGHGERADEVRRRYLDALSGEERKMAEEEDEEEFAMRTSAGETNAGRKNMMNRLLSTFACRPGTVTPLHTTIPNPTNPNTANATSTPAVPTPPKKYTLAYLSHKIHRTQKREEEAKLRERLMAIRLPESSAPRTHHIENINNNNDPTEVPVLIPKPKAKRRKDSTQPNPPSLVPNLESRTQSVIGPPVGLSQMIQRAPGSVRVVTPLPVSVSSETGSSGGERGEEVEEEVQRGPRQEHSGSSLSDRLRKTQLEDLPLQQDAAKEIRDLMMALERDQHHCHPTTTPPPPQHTNITATPNHLNPPTPPTQQADSLPAGFSRPETTPSSGHTQPSLSAHETLERHFRTQRQVNERFIRPIRAITSQSSSRTLPRSYRVPEDHSNGRGVLRVTNVVVQGEGLEGSNEVGVDDEAEVDERSRDGGGVDSIVENQQAGTGELAADGEEQKGESLLRYNGDEEGGKDVSEAG